VEQRTQTAKKHKLVRLRVRERVEMRRAANIRKGKRGAVNSREELRTEGKS
jgi:hypothetical protein